MKAFISERYNYQYSPVGLGRNVIIGYALGFATGASLFLMFLFPSVWRFFASVFFFALFHLMEFLMTAVGQPQSVSSTCTLSVDITYLLVFAVLRKSSWLT